MTEYKRKTGTEDLEGVTLVCLACRSERVIHVPKKRRMEKIHYWECFDCLKLVLS